MAGREAVHGAAPAGKARSQAAAEAGRILPCRQCPHVRACLPADVAPEHLSLIQGMITRQRVLQPGQRLFNVGEEFTSLFAVRSGYLKTLVLDADGREHILNFHLPGEVLGFAAIYQERFAGSAVALTAATVCYISFRELMHLASTFPQLVLRLLRIASRSALYTGWLTGDHQAIVRVAAFLLSLSGRMRAQGASATDFELVMSREDIANHLRLAPETVSRVLTQLRAERAISVRRKAVRLLDEKRLNTLAGPMMPYGWKPRA